MDTLGIRRYSGTRGGESSGQGVKTADGNSPFLNSPETALFRLAPVSLGRGDNQRIVYISHETVH